MKAADLGALERIQKTALTGLRPAKPLVSVGMGTCGIGNGADVVYAALAAGQKKKGTDFILAKVGCFGFCAEEPLVSVVLPGQPMVFFHRVTEKDVPKLLQQVSSGTIQPKKALFKIEDWDFLTGKISYGSGLPTIPPWNEIPFFQGQKKIVLRDCGLIDPENIEQYIAVGGYRAVFKALREMSPDAVIAEMKVSKLRGRGGAGFPTWRKWELMKVVEADQKYVICNADEGDPGAYMNRNEIESDPHMLIEGMLIGAFAMGATKGIVYVRAEYPLAVERLRKAVADAREYGILGPKACGSSFPFDLEIVEGAGAFVCGEETALMASIEGRAGRPMPRPPFPAQKGLYGKPTNINNVETWCNVPVILARGGKWFTETGTETSPGTKVFSLVGKVKNTGLVELPLGTSLETIVYQMGEGAGKKKKIRAVQTGGPSGGCIPSDHFHTPVDYESLNSLGAIMGSGGMVVMDQDNCMVDVARYFVEFTASESCGKCTPCREGLSQSLAILNGITRGKATEKDLDTLESLASVIKNSSLCALGQTSANPVQTTLKYFRDEYLAHIKENRCQAGVCQDLFLELCENSCPMHMNIPGYLQLLKEGRLEDAFESTLRDNPLPGTIGRICHFHCQMRCRRETVDAPVSQGEIHRYLADTMYKMGKEKQIYDKIIKEKHDPTGKSIAIVGGGPAGLTAAYYLVRLGHKVTVYDNHAKCGGITRYGIPNYRLPSEVLEKEADFIRKLGVKFVFNTTIGKDLSLSVLAKDNDAVFLAVGAQKDIPLSIPGDSLKGVYLGYELLELFAKKKMPPLGENVAIVGAGNVAIDMARTALRLGANVTVVYRRDKASMPANESEIEDAEAEAIRFVFMASPNKVIGDGNGRVHALEIMKMKLGPTDASGRRKPVATGETDIIACDSLVIATGERVESGFVKDVGIKTRGNGTIEVNPFTLQTSVDHVFAGGDAVSGPATAAEAMGQAKKAAEAIDYYLTGERRFHSLFPKIAYGNQVPAQPEGGPRNYGRKTAVKDRIKSFVEVAQGFTGEQAHREASRCLRCDVKEERK